MLNTCSPMSYLPSNVSTSTEEIQITLSSSNQQDQSLFGDQKIVDIKIYLNTHILLLHKSVLSKSIPKLYTRLTNYSSGFFEIMLPSQINIQVLNQILLCLYGYKVSIKRCQVMDAYVICEYFEMTQLMEILRDDMISNFDQYQIFPLLKLSNRFQIKNVLNYCYLQLQSQQFQPMKYNKSGLMICQEQIFKQIIHQHNYFKSQNQSCNKYGLSQEQISCIITQYCENNDYTEQKKNNLISQIQNENCKSKYIINLSEVDRKVSTPVKFKSSSEVILRNTLSLPNSKYESLVQLKDMNIMNDKTLESSESSSQGSYHERSADSKSQHQIQGNRYRCETQQSAIFIENQNQQKDQFLADQTRYRNSTTSSRSRRYSIGSNDTALTDPRVLKLIETINQNEKVVEEDNLKMTQKLIELNKRAQAQHKQSKYRKAKLENIETLLEQIEYDMKKDQAKVNLLQISVNGLQKNVKQSQRIDKKVLQTKIGLNLTQSTHFEDIFAQKKTIRM